jgi:phosphate starvation-inducible protein PhoH
MGRAKPRAANSWQPNDSANDPTTANRRRSKAQMQQERDQRNLAKAERARVEAAQALQAHPPVVHNNDTSTHITINFNEAASEAVATSTAPAQTNKVPRKQKKQLAKTSPAAYVPQSKNGQKNLKRKQFREAQREANKAKRAAEQAQKDAARAPQNVPATSSNTDTVTQETSAATTSITVTARPHGKAKKSKQPPAVATATAPETASATPMAEAFAPRNAEQAEFLNALQNYPLVFGIGPAGTGKTFLAAMAGIELLKAGVIDSIILTRAPVEAGKELGFLPGSADAKMAPYIDPLFESLKKVIGEKPFNEMLRKKQIVVKPINYMRGATIENSLAIVDEAQNLTRKELQLVMGRLGNNGRMVFIGDPAQVDLQPHQSVPQRAERAVRQAFINAKRAFGMPARDMLVPPDASGFAETIRLFEQDVIPLGAVGADYAKVVRLEDVQRHPLVQDVLTAYDRATQPLPTKRSEPSLRPDFVIAQAAITTRNPPSVIAAPVAAPVVMAAENTAPTLAAPTAPLNGQSHNPQPEALNR